MTVGLGSSDRRSRIRRFVDLAEAVLAAPARLGPVRLVAVDGRAGSGKSTFARRFAAEAQGVGASVTQVHTDDLLEGWAGIVSFWPRLEQGVLGPLAAGGPGEYHCYDWDAGRFRSEPAVVPVPDVLIIEGVTSARAALCPRATLTVRVVAPRHVRLSRGIARDGEGLRQQWLRWMAAEEAHFAAEASGRQDLVVDGASGLRHDLEREYVEACGDWRRAET